MRLIQSESKTKHCVFFDNNIFRAIKTHPMFSENLFCFAEKESLAIFDDFEPILSWPQLLEDTGLGKRLEKYLVNINSEGLSVYEVFNIMVAEISSAPELEKQNLLDKINDSIRHAAKGNEKLLTDSTLKKYYDLIKLNDYVDGMVYTLAWCYITANRSLSFDSFDLLIFMWHKLFTEGIELDLFRLLDARYTKIISASREYSHDHKKSYKERYALKPVSDLCDSLMVHYAAFGSAKIPVISVTLTTEREEKRCRAQYENRMGLIRDSTIKLEKEENWKVEMIPGKIVIFTVDNSSREIVRCHVIPFDRPLK